jgi:EAL domain-containing protein (putative c-di-GMP-specific phosphodiesterase class I)
LADFEPPDPLAPHLEKRCIDLGTGLPSQPAACEDIARLTQQLDPAHCLGIIDLAVLPDPALLRLTPEVSHNLRVSVTRRIQSALRPQDRLYAVDQWEWLIVLAELPSSAPLMLALIRLDALFAEPVPALDERLLLRVACGGSLCPDDGTDTRHLVQSARIARLHADRSGSRYAAYAPAMEQGDRVQQQLHAELPRALSGAPGLSLQLQPQIELADGSCRACEGLLRWQLPTGKWISPPHALAVVERLGLRGTFTRWLLQQAMQVQAGLRAEGIQLVLSINLSANDLLDAELPELIEQTLATWELAPDCLLLELTETLMIEDTEEVIGILDRLRRQGFQLSVDDFGTGYASMSYLQRLPVQEVKIDQSFVLHAASSERDREIIASVVQLAHRLGMLVVAEGVETAAAAEIVGRLGCDRGQGYFYARAMPLDDFIAWWRDHQSRLR